LLLTLHSKLASLLHTLHTTLVISLLHTLLLTKLVLLHSLLLANLVLHSLLLAKLVLLSESSWLLVSESLLLVIVSAEHLIFFVKILFIF